MLVNCKPGCIGKKVTTNAALDVDSNEVICDFCGESLAVSSFVKNSMKQRGDIIRTDNRKSFQFECTQCNKKVQTKIVGDDLAGIDCDGDCMINVSKFTIHAMKSIRDKKVKRESIDE